MRCPRCGKGTNVVDSRGDKGYVRRRRKCVCGKKFTTLEVDVERPLTGSGPLVEELIETISRQAITEYRAKVMQNIFRIFDFDE